MAFVILIGAFSASLFAGLTVHEFSHALVADNLGDPTPRRAGRLSLNPKDHLDPIGSTLIFFVGFGWAKPVPVNPRYAQNPQRAMAMIALAGPAANVVIAGLAGIPIKVGWVPGYHPFVNPAFASQFAQIWTASPKDMLGLFFGTIVLLNVVLAVFNLIPLAPLDGFNVVLGLLPPDLAREFAKTAPWGIGILLVLLFLPRFGGFESPITIVMGPAIDFLLTLFVGDVPSFRFG
jgi:Zn-dependent protease